MMRRRQDAFVVVLAVALAVVVIVVLVHVGRLLMTLPPLRLHIRVEKLPAIPARSQAIFHQIVPRAIRIESPQEKVSRKKARHRRSLYVDETPSGSRVRASDPPKWRSERLR